MTVDYNPRLYREMAQFKCNRFVKVTSRKGRSRVIHITEIHKLKWEDLQVLIGGENRFTCQIYLYRALRDHSDTIRGEWMSEQESNEMVLYIELCKKHKFDTNRKVNNYITENNLWDEFKAIRSLNDHGKGKEKIPGITPVHYHYVNSIIPLSGSGESIKNYQRY